MGTDRIGNFDLAFVASRVSRGAAFRHDGSCGSAALVAIACVCGCFTWMNRFCVGAAMRVHEQCIHVYTYFKSRIGHPFG